jgi:hypothetical protein
MQLNFAARNREIIMELEAPVVEADPTRSRGGGGEEDTLQTRTPKN